MIDLLSKLLANENITLQRGNYRTASFNINSRVLQLPTLVGMSDEEELLMVLHEVGHALFTDQSYIKNIESNKEKKRFHQYMNIIEDVRIERKIKNLYPGSRKDFFQGYKLLNERDFFGISGADLTKYSLIDRINLFFKSGYSCGVKFSPREMEFVREAELTETLDDVQSLALRIYAYASQQHKESIEQQSDIEFDEEPNFGDDEEFGDGDADEFDDSEDAPSRGTPGDESEEESKDEVDANGNGEGDDSEDDAPEAKTQSIFDEKMSNSVQDANNPAVFVKPLLATSYQFMPFREYRSMQGGEAGEFYYHVDISSIKRSAAYLHREFEIKKAAYRYARNTVAKSGSLNVNKLHQYKTSDDMFKKYNISPDDKNHGMIVLLDFSGSMMEARQSAINELYTLAIFCHMSKIPFRFFFFSSSTKKNLSYHYNKTHTLMPGENGFVGSSMSLVEMANSKHPWKENEQSFQRMLRHNFGGYTMHNTPLVESLLILSNDIIGQFKQEHSLQKVSLVTITDGAGNSIQIQNNGYTYNTYNRKESLFVEDMGKKYPTIKRRVQHTLMTVIKNRHPYLQTIGYFIVGSFSKTNIREFIRAYDTSLDNITGAEHWDAQERKIEQMIKNKKDNVIVAQAEGYDSMMIFRGNTIQEDFNIGDIKENATAASISKTFAKGMKAGIGNKVVLSNLVACIS